jgi:hypothetical protein
MGRKGIFLSVLLALHAFLALSALRAQSGASYIPYADAKPIFDVLRSDLLPVVFRDKSSAQRERMWAAWVVQRDADIRARVVAGDEDSVINLLLYGTSFTKRPRPTERQIVDLVERPAAALTWLRPRIDDLVAGIAMPGGNERLQFARDVLRNKNGDAAKQYLEQRAIEMSATGALRTRGLLDASSTTADRVTVFRERGLSSDTSIFIDYAVDATLEALKREQQLAAGTVRRVAIIGPGLDFSDKLDGYDFYPPQTIQAFAVIDSLQRLGFAASDVQVTAFDLSSRVLTHLDGARMRARAGEGYRVVLPRNLDQRWSTALVRYWQRFGDRIGARGPVLAPPPNAGRAEVRTVLVRPDVALSVASRDLNIVLQHPEPAGEPFDLVIATNILLYYDVFEQSLAGITIAKMLRPGGFLLTNDRIFELPTTPLSGVGFTDVSYFAVGGIGNTGARVIWYRHQ